jgi:type II secretory pathway pseudopilin PulG
VNHLVRLAAAVRRWLAPPLPGARVRFGHPRGCLPAAPDFCTLPVNPMSRLGAGCGWRRQSGRCRGATELPERIRSGTTPTSRAAAIRHGRPVVQLTTRVSRTNHLLVNVRCYEAPCTRRLGSKLAKRPKQSTLFGSPMDLLGFFRELPPRYRHAWTALGVSALILVVFSVVIGPQFVNVGQWLKGLPRVLLVVLVLFAIAALILFNLSASVQDKKSRAAELERLEARLETRLDAIAANVELLLATGRPIVIGEIYLPAPAPDKKIGGAGAVKDTVKAGSLSEVSPTVASALFTNIKEPTALVNAALDGRVTILKLSLDTVASESVGKPHHFARLEMANATEGDLVLEIPKGQVFENASRSEKIQNLVVAEAIKVTCLGRSRQSVVVPAYCLNQHLGPPHGLDGNITPLKVKFSFNSQESVWMRVSEAQA